MEIFEFTDCRYVIQEWVSKKGRGELGKIARHLRLHTTTLSQVVSGTRALTIDQALNLSQYFGLTEQETRYFLTVAQKDRAATVELKQFLNNQLQNYRAERTDLRKTLPRSPSISDAQQAKFYANWHYSAIRVISSIPEFRTVEQIAAQLRLPRRLVVDAVDYLVSLGLCVREYGSILPGPKYTHLPADSPHIVRHHANWRLKAMERHTRMTDEELAYSAPMSLSRADARKVRELLVKSIQQLQKIRDSSACEVPYILNVDWTVLE